MFQRNRYPQRNDAELVGKGSKEPVKFMLQNSIEKHGLPERAVFLMLSNLFR